jgi:RNA polymerase sigma-70 factor, ECF subfamily
MTNGVEARLWQDAEWLQRLARALVRDVSSADDLVQEVWLTALRAQPRFKGSARPWLAKVARNLVRSRVRSARSHDRWERLSTGAEGPPSPESLITEQEALRIMRRLLSGLDEPYRSTIFLCYGEGLTPSQVARRLGLAPGTVRWRLKCALDRLRAQLDGEGGRRRRVRALALVGVAPPRRARAWVAQTPLALRVGLIAAGATLLGLTAVLAGRPGGRPPAVASVAPRHEPNLASAPRFRRLPPLSPRAGGGIPAWVAQSGVAAGRIAGRVLEGGAPAAGVRVALGHQLARYGALAPMETLTDRDGSFDFGPQIASSYTVMARAPGRAIAALRVDLRQPEAQVAADALLLTLRPCDDGLEGQIVDPGGLPIAGARVLASGLLGVTTGADGGYQLCVEPGRLDTRVEASGYGTILIKADVAGRLRRDVVLVPQASVAGQVLDEGGGPVENAHVRAWRADPGPRERFIGPASVISDGHGRFQLAALEPGRWLFSADAEGAMAGSPVERALPTGWSEQPVTLSVRKAVKVAGRVLERGRPVVGATVALVSTTSGASSDSARTQDDGGFVVDRVQPGDLRAIVRGYLVLQPVVAGPSAAQRLEIAVERPARIHGRVVRAGRPVAHAWIGLRDRPDRRAFTAGDGSFTLEGIPSGTHGLSIDGEPPGPAATITVAAGETLSVTLDLPM